MEPLEEAVKQATGNVDILRRWPIVGLSGEYVESAPITQYGIYGDRSARIRVVGQRRNLNVPVATDMRRNTQAEIEKILEAIPPSALLEYKASAMDDLSIERFALQDGGSWMNFNIESPDGRKMNLADALSHLKTQFGVGFDMDFFYSPSRRSVAIIQSGDVLDMEPDQNARQDGGYIFVTWGQMPNYESLKGKLLRIGESVILKIVHTEPKILYASVVPGAEGRIAKDNPISII